MIRKISLTDISGFFFSSALFLLCFEPAIFFSHDYKPIFIITILFAYLTGLPLFLKDPIQGLKKGFRSLLESLTACISLLPLFLYLIFDRYSLKWTENPVHILSKYEVMIPLIFVLLYAIFYFFDGSISEEQRQGRVFGAVFAPAFAAFVLALITYFYLHIYGRTYFILRTSLQLNYNRFVQSLMLGYLCGIYLISKIDHKNKYLLFLLYAVLLVPLFYTSGSRKSMVMALPAFLFSGLPFLVEALKMWRTKKSAFFLILMTLALTLGSCFYIIRSFEIRSMAVYQEMQSLAEKQGQNPPSAMEKSHPGIIHDFMKERPLRAVQDTIESGEAAGQRKVIYQIVHHRLTEFTREEWIRGAGGSEAYFVFISPYAQDAIKTHQIDSISHPHSFVFLDLLNGGLIKLGLTLLMILSAITLCFQFLPRDYHAFFFLVSYGGVYLANELTNSNLGLQANGLTWVFLIFLMGLRRLYNRPKGPDEKENKDQLTT